jgi:16S rRNA C967 or C1407 C5-methylase (RsmB/RsmF family)
VKRRVNFDVNKEYYMRRLTQTTRRASSASVKVRRADQRHGALQTRDFVRFARILLNAEDSGTVSGQFERSGDLRWNRALRNSTVFSAPRESCFLARPAF